MVKIYTRGGDDGTTALRVGGRVRKDDPIIELLGAIDESQAALGAARAQARADDDGSLDQLLSDLERDLWILMAEVATEPSKASSLVGGVTAVSEEMVESLEAHITGFRGSEAFSQWRAIIGPFFDGQPVVDHYDAPLASAP